MTRIKNDAYYTPLPLYKWLSDRLQLTEQRIFDPCCGNSHPTALTFGKDNLVIENDIVLPENSDRYCFDATENWDLHLPEYVEGNIDWVITNPPYKRGMSEAIVEQSLINAQEGVAMLLRLTWLEPCRNRANLLRCYGDTKTLKAVYPVSPRPKFNPWQNGNDSVTVAWFIWGNDSVVLPPFDFCTGWKNNEYST